MENVNTILENIAANQDRIKVLSEKLDNMRYSQRDTSPEYREQHELKIINSILSDNARQSLYAYILPHIIKKLQKYAGKSYGKVTSKKITDELYSEIECRVFLHREGIDVFADKVFAYRKITIYGTYSQQKGGHFRVLDENNKIVVPTPDDLHLGECGAYVENPAERAMEIIEKFNKIREAEKALSSMCKEFNSILPNSIERVYSRAIRSFLM